MKMFLISFCSLKTVIHWSVISQLFLISFLWIGSISWVSRMRVRNCFIFIITRFPLVLSQTAFLSFLRCISRRMLWWLLWKFWFSFLFSRILLYFTISSLLNRFSYNYCMLLMTFRRFYRFSSRCFLNSWMRRLQLLFFIDFTSLADSTIVLERFLFNSFLLLIYFWHSFTFFPQLIRIWFFPFFLFSQKSHRLMQLIFFLSCWFLSSRNFSFFSLIKFVFFTLTIFLIFFLLLWVWHQITIFFISFELIFGCWIWLCGMLSNFAIAVIFMNSCSSMSMNPLSFRRERIRSMRKMMIVRVLITLSFFSFFSFFLNSKFIIMKRWRIDIFVSSFWWIVTYSGIIVFLYWFFIFVLIFCSSISFLRRFLLFIPSLSKIWLRSRGLRFTFLTTTPFFVHFIRTSFLSRWMFRILLMFW